MCINIWHFAVLFPFIGSAFLNPVLDSNSLLVQMELVAEEQLVSGAHLHTHFVSMPPSLAAPWQTEFSSLHQPPISVDFFTQEPQMPAWHTLFVDEVPVIVSPPHFYLHLFPKHTKYTGRKI